MTASRVVFYSPNFFNGCVRYLFAVSRITQMQWLVTKCSQDFAQAAVCRGQDPVPPVTGRKPQALATWPLHRAAAAEPRWLRPLHKESHQVQTARPELLGQQQAR